MCFHLIFSRGGCSGVELAMRKEDDNTSTGSIQSINTVLVARFTVAEEVETLSYFLRYAPSVVVGRRPELLNFAAYHSRVGVA